MTVASFLGFSISFSYYGLAMDLQNFGVSIYLIQVIFGAVDVPAKLVVTVSVSYVGRRLSLMVALFLAGLVIIANIFVSTDLEFQPRRFGSNRGDTERFSPLCPDRLVVAMDPTGMNRTR
ncbi:hypothetical protein AV530_001643 [Patagioenas fasciata monilis]|uniref:Uncharacterized protein n=1 Tax=Patagioenas fasciata monilis TaxID=372326 RepID=A0A1V4KXU2_PATFA|nr:hypothetical protein AV530_001643 [Patagioenas fasciata monilis]